MNQSQTETIRNPRALKERQALFRRFGYDSTASLKFILAKVLAAARSRARNRHRQRRFPRRDGKHADHITTLDDGRDQQRRRNARSPDAGRVVRFDTSFMTPNGCLGPDGSFDSVASVNTFHHLERPMRVFKEMLRVLKPGGKLVLCDFSPRGFQIFDRIHRFEGGTHPRLKNGLADFARLLRHHGWKTKRLKGATKKFWWRPRHPSQRKENTNMTTTTAPKENIIRIAIPTADGKLHGHFGGCSEFTLVDADPKSRTVISTQTIAAPPHKPGLYPRWLREQGVRVVIAGGMGRLSQ